ncbi:MAG TPA: hypothetical protein VGN97_08140 [Mesorhizobium sp.]|jgi:hypothetical protein|nr:hypothetical protein [Mesorhizobium sp.]
MADHDDMELTPEELAEIEAEIADERRRELAVEHLLFGTISFLAKRHPELLDELEGSIEHLGDSADDDTKDDEAVREIARLFLQSLRAEG